MTSELLQNAKSELINGYAKKHHPFRYFTLATLHNNSPKQRTVVMRRLLKDFEILFYTDQRSNKVAEIQENANVSALFYHPIKLLQIQLIGQAKIITDPTEVLEYWGRVQGLAKNDYTTFKAPGSTLNSPDNVKYTDDRHNFCPIVIQPIIIDYLQLKRPNHLRVRYTKISNSWKGQFLVP